MKFTATVHIEANDLRGAWSGLAWAPADLSVEETGKAYAHGVRGLEIVSADGKHEITWRVE